MDGARLSRFPHLSWFGWQFVAPVDGRPCSHHFRHTNHVLYATIRGRESVRWIGGGREIGWNADDRTVHFTPANDEPITVVASVSPDYAGLVLNIPRRHLWEIGESEGVAAAASARRLLTNDEPVLWSCIVRLVSPMSWHGRNVDSGNDEVARRLVLRLLERSGSGTPDWHADASVFDRRTLGYLVGYIDAHLLTAPSLHDMGRLVGLSPSHFARKFRQSIGLSLHRFINRRRLGRSLEMLKVHSAPISGVALDLGFTSQSHFTRLFSDLTGMTPAKYRSEFKRTVG